MGVTPVRQVEQSNWIELNVLQLSTLGKDIAVQGTEKSTIIVINVVVNYKYKVFQQ
jgi:hypothetical protein